MSPVSNGRAHQNAPLKRVILVVLDGVGAGATPDAPNYGDEGSDTLGNLSREFKKRQGRALSLPHLESWGLGKITSIEGVSASKAKEGAAGRAAELSTGKDTTSGHWEMAGYVVKEPFAIFPDGFPKAYVDRWVRSNNLPGVLGNKAASGTEIITELGEEHVKTGKPILYTSADSVWQVAAHESAFGLEKLYQICKSARHLCDEMGISRVIARPFVGDSASTFKRTYNRKDFAQRPNQPTYLDYLVGQGVPTLGIGKISNIYAGFGIQENVDTAGNTDGIRVLLEKMATVESGLIFCNLIDFDMLYGHRRDVPGFGGALEEFDRAIPELKKRSRPGDLVILTADHGNDPTFHGTDHTREYIPFVAYAPATMAKGCTDLGIRDSFADIGATTAHALTGSAWAKAGLPGRSALADLGIPGA
jgi:phosphopentomutase